MSSQRILEYTPRKFDIGVPDVALDYLQRKEQGFDFKMNDTIKVQTGVSDVEAIAFQDKIERLTLEKLSEVQTLAYEEAYKLGLEEGKRDAYESYKEKLNEQIEQLNLLLKSVSHLKFELFQQNESHLVKLAFHVGVQLAKREIHMNEDSVVDILKDAISLSQTDEQVRVKVNPSQFQFLEELKKDTTHELEFLKNMKFESDEAVSRGGCIIETNYGEIDARIEEKIQKLWENLNGSLHKIKEKVSA